MQAVCRAVGYRSTHLPEVPFDHVHNVVPNQAGRVLGIDETQLPGVYVTGRIVCADRLTAAVENSGIGRVLIMLEIAAEPDHVARSVETWGTQVLPEVGAACKILAGRRDTPVRG